MTTAYLTEDKLVRVALRHTRKANTQGEAAKMLGVARSHFVNFIAGRKRPGPRILRRLGMLSVVRYTKKPPAKKRAAKAVAKPPVKKRKAKAVANGTA
jgi:hypothetical protein